MHQGYHCGPWAFIHSVCPSLLSVLYPLTNRFMCVPVRERVYVCVGGNTCMHRLIYDCIESKCVCLCVCVFLSLQPGERNGSQQQTHTVSDLSEVIVSASRPLVIITYTQHLCKCKFS